MKNVYHLTGVLRDTGEKQEQNISGDIQVLPVVEVAGHRGMFSNLHPRLPQIGDRVIVTFNGFGPGTVVGFFVESGYVGLEVRVDKRPDWHIRQNGDRHPHPLCFGAEIELL